MRLAGRTMIPASLMLRRGSVLSGMHVGAAPADGTDLPGHADLCRRLQIGSTRSRIAQAANGLSKGQKTS
jgi:hypothetical protein